MTGNTPTDRSRSRRFHADLWAVVDERRVAAMAHAVELGVDRDEFEFASEVERAAWLELEAEYEVLVEREGPVWAAER